MCWFTGPLSFRDKFQRKDTLGTHQGTGKFSLVEAAAKSLTPKPALALEAAAKSPTSKTAVALEDGQATEERGRDHATGKKRVKNIVKRRAR